MMALATDYSRHIENGLDAWLPDIITPPGRLHEAMRYSIFAGGKRLRPRLTLAACEALGADPLEALAPAVAIEMIHTYSLIHDDLPAMDNDDLRRGRPTSHKVFGEAMAILAGDALLTEAFTVLAEQTKNKALIPALVRAVSLAAGRAGMVGGQVADMAGEGKAAGLDLVKFIHLRKTAALIAACFECGAICAGADPSTVSRYRKSGETLGLAFQIIDDVLDETSTPEALGKTPGKDLQSGKLTYPKVIGLDRSKKMAMALKEEALAQLNLEANHGTELTHLIEACVSRVN
ncbi:MAG: polyprenyl synthetase family protein [Planctomycetota bacterium]